MRDLSFEFRCRSKASDVSVFKICLVVAKTSFCQMRTLFPLFSMIAHLDFGGLKSKSSPQRMLQLKGFLLLSTFLKEINRP